MVLNTILHKTGLHITKGEKADRIPWLLKTIDQSESIIDLIAPILIAKHDLKHFVQVGANDGEKGDPFEDCVRNCNLKGILVEPQPQSCNRLRQRYANNANIIIEESAIGEKGGRFPLYYLDDKTCKPKFDYHYDQLTSGDRNHLENLCKQMGIDLPIREIEVEAVTWSKLLEKNNFPNPDIVIVDTEGMDDLIVNQVNLEQKPPMLIQFEYLHIPTKRLDFCSSRLKDAGYKFIVSEYDLLCIHHQARV